MKIRKFQTKDTKEAALLARNVFMKYNGLDYFEKEGVERTLIALDPEKNPNLSEDFKKTSIFYVAEEGNKIIGIIRGTKERMNSFFVDESYQKKGIGRKLVSKFEETAKKSGSQKIKVEASLYAVPFYQKVGYKKSTGMRNFKGLKVFPMRKTLT